jgi:hypothetical protein
MRHLSALLAVVAAGLGCVLGGCSGASQVSLTGNTPAQFSHVWVTTTSVWVNESATAGPDDGGWTQYSLSSPTTIDLVAANSTNISSITSNLRLVPGTYSQVRLIPVDATAPLSQSAQYAGALYNSEADYVDSSGNTHQLPLELLNPDKGIGIPTALKVPIGNIGAALAAGAGGLGSGTSTTGTTDTGTTDTTTGTGTTGTGTGIGFGGSSSSSVPANQYVVDINGASDLVQFNYGGTNPGVMLSQHASASDLSQSGGISGQLTLTNITTSTSGLPNIQVSAQVLSADGTRHVIATSTTVQSDGSFLLYPLAASTNGTWYDVVISGPSIATIIIESVEVTLPSSSSTLGSSGLGVGSTSTLSSDTTNTETSTGTTTGTTTTTTGTTTTSSGITANNVVAIGTLTPRSATPYCANVTGSTSAPLPAGTLIGFYQTLGTKNSVPYIIQEQPIDPFNQVLFTPQALSAATVDSGTWSSSGAALSIVSAAPREGAGNYIVSPSAPAYGDGSLTTIVDAPSSASSSSSSSSSSSTSTCTGTVTVTAPALKLASGTASGTLTAKVALATAGKYDHGELMVSSNGTLVGTASLDAAYAQEGGGTVTVSGLPAEIPTAAYYVTVRSWTTANPTAVERQWFDTLVDMRGSASGSIELTVN